MSKPAFSFAMLKSRTQALVESVSASYWFLPSLMVLISLLLGAVVVWLDTGPASNLLDGLGWYQKVKAEGAHQVLSTIAGSMITVAGVTFSITIVAIAFAANQYGPRILSNFMSDRGNQFTLGTFIATFVYCLVVLRTIRGGDQEAFVPQLGVLTGLLLALCSIAVLIYFIHHVPESIHINNVTARIGRRMIATIPKRFPKSIGEPADPPRDRPAAEPDCAIRAGETGYIQSIDDETLMELACTHDLVVWLHHRPGDFVHCGRTLLKVAPADRAHEAESALQALFSVGVKRTPADDLDFLASELVEIAARALSPGVNDPVTANTCIDWLGAAASELAERRTPPELRADEEGIVRVVACVDDFEWFLHRGFGRLRQYVSADVMASEHLLRVLAVVREGCPAREQRAACANEARHLLEAARARLTAPEYRALSARAAWALDLMDQAQPAL